MPPHPNVRASWPSRDDNTGFYLIITLACCCVFAILLWNGYHAAISAAVMVLHHHEIGFIRHFTSRYDLADRQMAQAAPNGVTLHDLYGIARDVGGFFRVPAAILMLVLAVACMLRAAPSRYCRAFDLDGLIREQAISFRTTAAFVDRHLRLVPPLSGASLPSPGAPPPLAFHRLSPTEPLPAPSSAEPRPADYALTPEEWIARFATGRDGGFDEAAARQNLILQLGPPWRGIDQASPQVRCLLAVFALQLAAQRAEALTLLGDLSAGLGTRGEDKPEGPETSLSLPDSVVAQADAILRDRALLTPALAVMQRPAYTHTALMAVLNAARLQAGVLASGQFAWLKLVDRRLWYALHSLGFETEGFGRYLHPNPRVEALGARDHWAAERIAGVPIVEPDIARAMDALRRVAAPRSRRPARLT